MATITRAKSNMRFANVEEYCQQCGNCQDIYDEVYPISPSSRRGGRPNLQPPWSAYATDPVGGRNPQVGRSTVRRLGRLAVDRRPTRFWFAESFTKKCFECTRSKRLKLCIFTSKLDRPNPIGTRFRKIGNPKLRGRSRELNRLTDFANPRHVLSPIYAERPPGPLCLGPTDRPILGRARAR